MGDGWLIAPSITEASGARLGIPAATTSAAEPWDATSFPAGSAPPRRGCARGRAPANRPRLVPAARRARGELAGRECAPWLPDGRTIAMAWTAPRTWVAAEILTAALLNTHLRDNLLETGPAKVTTQGDLLYATAANALTRLAKGTADQQLRMNAGATAPEWAKLLPAAGVFVGGWG